MLRQARVLLMAALAFAALRVGSEAANAPVRVHVRHVHRRVWVGPRRPFLVPQPPSLYLPRPDEITPPNYEEPAPIPAPSPEEQSEPLQFPHGFRLTVPVGNAAKPAAPARLNRFVEVGRALGACWSPPTDGKWSSLTLRVSFKRDGSVNGMARVPFVDAADPDQKAALARSLLAGLNTCTPLPFSPSLGASIAGEIFAIRFVNQDAR